MPELHRFLLPCVLNSLWQVPAVALVAWMCSVLLRRTSFLVQHRLWVASLFAAVVLPLVSGFGWFAGVFSPSYGRFHAQANRGVRILFDAAGKAPPAPGTMSGWLGLNVANVLLALWLGAVLYRAASLLWSWRRLRGLLAGTQEAALPEPLAVIWQASGAGGSLRVSSGLAAPATLGVRKPLVLIPPSLLASASPAEFEAILAHESAHIRRHDFVWNLLYELIALPIAYHPVLRLLRSRVADSRELVCDALAADEMQNPALYAQSLLQVAQAVSGAASSPMYALGIFEGRNLERRVTTLLDRRPRLGIRGTAIAVFSCSLVFGGCCFAATGYNFQPSAVVAGELKPYAGVWHWMFQGKPFVTLTLVPAGNHLGGSLSNGFIDNDSEGNITAAGSHPGTSPVMRTFFAGTRLHIVVADPNEDDPMEWTMELVGPDKAEFRVALAGAPKNLKPWMGERVAETAQVEGQVYRSASEISPPKILFAPEPEFPKIPTADDFDGTCLVSLVVDSTGAPRQVHIVRSLTPEFDRQAIEAVEQYKFVPAVRYGQPVAFSMNVEIHFRKF